VFDVGTRVVPVRGKAGLGVVTVFGAVVGGSAAFLVRGSCGTGVVTVLGFVVVGSAAFFVRGFGVATVVGFDGDARCAWAAPAATSPPPRRARVIAAARTGRRFDISEAYAFGPNVRSTFSDCHHCGLFMTGETSLTDIYGRAYGMNVEVMAVLSSNCAVTSTRVVPTGGSGRSMR
jgi:hypothetical protein